MISLVVKKNSWIKMKLFLIGIANPKKNLGLMSIRKVEVKNLAKVLLQIMHHLKV